MDYIKTNVVNNLDSIGLIHFIGLNKDRQGRHLLNLDKKYEDYDLLERAVYDVSNFKSKRLHSDNQYVEFWFKTDHFNDNGLHLDCDEHLKRTNSILEYPLLSLILYLNDNPVPTIITNKSIEENETIPLSLFISKCKSNKLLSFLPSYFHGAFSFNNYYDGSKRYIIAVNIWDKKPEALEYYNNILKPISSIKQSVNFMNESIQTLNMDLSTDIINIDLFNAIKFNLSKYDYNDFIKKIDSFMQNNNYSNLKIVSGRNVCDDSIFNIKNKIDDFNSDIDEIMIDFEHIKYNRFQQRFIYDKLMPSIICDWIVCECEKYALSNNGWTINRHGKYPTTDLAICNIPIIFGLVTRYMSIISDKILSYYNLPNNTIVNYNDLFIVRYKSDEQNYLEMHRDGSLLSFNILLSNESTFKGGGTYFEDGLIIKPSQGDLLIHCGKTKHAGLPITFGTRYILVGFIDLNIKI